MDFFTDAELASALPVMPLAGPRLAEEELNSGRGLSEISNAPRPSKRQLAKPRGSVDTEVVVGIAKEESPHRGGPVALSVKSFVSVGAKSTTMMPTPTPSPPSMGMPAATISTAPGSQEGPNLLSRWYQLIGEMQCLMAQMQQLGIVPPQPFPNSTPFAPVPAVAKSGGSPTTAGTPTPVSVTVGHKPPASPIPSAASWEEAYAQEEEMMRKHQGAVASHGHAHRPSSGSPSAEPAPFIALVEFKRQRIRRFEATLFVNPGEYVIVDGDRGTDCGFVVQCSVRNADGTFGRTESIDSTPIDANRVKAETGRIHRVASPDEIDVLHGELASMERFALGKCRQFVGQKQLRMEIVDCEFQFDRKKVTFFFDSQEAIDFRELTKELYRFFGTRIWLENINSKVKNVVPDGALSHADKLMYASRGLRAPRR